MRNAKWIIGIGLSGLMCGLAAASEASTSAGAGAGLAGPGSAWATANYQGDRGFARTDTRSGAINLARGVAVGVDEDGLSLSISHAVAANGVSSAPAVASNFNLNIDRSGEVSTSNALVLANGGASRTVQVKGGVGHGRPAVAKASGATTHGGRVVAHTDSRTSHGDGRWGRVVRRPAGFLRR